MSCTCANTCNIHGDAHAAAWSSRLPIADLKSFWGVSAVRAGRYDASSTGCTPASASGAGFGGNK